MIADQHLRSSHALSIVNLVEECAELWDHPLAWQGHLAAGLERMLGGFACALMLHDPRNDGWRIEDRCLGEAVDDAGRESFERFVAEGGPMLLPGIDAALRQLTLRGRFCTRHTDLVGRDAYRRSDFYQRYMRPIGADDVLLAVVRCGNAVLSLALCRNPHERAFELDEIAAIQVLTTAAVQRVGSQLTTHAQVGRHRLSPREAQTLDALLSGDSEKQVAARLEIAVSTAHDYVRSLYREFGVQSRSELMARYLRRFPGK
jgi:DNA-binding CsgD family transcriptional regulator